MTHVNNAIYSGVTTSTGNQVVLLKNIDGYHYCGISYISSLGVFNAGIVAIKVAKGLYKEVYQVKQYPTHSED